MHVYSLVINSDGILLLGHEIKLGAAGDGGRVT